MQFDKFVKRESSLVSKKKSCKRIVMHNDSECEISEPFSPNYFTSGLFRLTTAVNGSRLMPN